MTKRILVVFGALVVVAVSYSTWAPARTDAAPVVSALTGLPSAQVTADPHRGEIVIELPPADLPAGAGHHFLGQPPVALARIPVGGSIYGFRTQLVDAAGRQLPPGLLHHFNLLEPTQRELFLPIARRVAAAGSETGAVRFPRLLLGSPVERGEQLVASVMLHNPTPESYRGVRVRLIMNYVPDRRPWPLFRAFPWQLDVAFPVGDKSFDLPPGRSERVYEGSPAVPGDIVAIGGHLHEYGVSIEFSDATTGEMIWRAQPVRDEHANVVGMPIGKLYGPTRLGAHVVPAHRYRVRVVYDNPTGRVLPGAGMGVVAGLFVPARNVAWPDVNAADSLYQQDLRHFLRLHGEWLAERGTDGADHAAHMHH
jgi:hypothetical protein